MRCEQHQLGISLVELLASIALVALLLAGTQQMLSAGLAARTLLEERIGLNRQARFAIHRMVTAVGGADRLLLPLADIPGTELNEAVREQTVPASPPPPGSSLATAVLAVTLNAGQDLDRNGVPDADNDGDGRIDEDLPEDAHNDGKAGIRDFDDDGNGTKDFWFSPAGDDDESNDFARNEDPVNGIDDDGDGNIDEDAGADSNGDSAPGIVGIDDDGDGNIDEGDVDDDDEDGQVDEDWLDPVVFYLQGSTLVERRAVPWDENGDGSLTGRDFVESSIADNVTLLRFERISHVTSVQLIDISLTLTAPSGETVSLNTRMRVGGDL